MGKIAASSTAGGGGGVLDIVGGVGDTELSVERVRDESEDSSVGSSVDRGKKSDKNSVVPRG